MFRLLSCGVAAMVSSAAVATPKPVTLDDIFTIKEVTQVAIRPDGRQAAFVTSQPGNNGSIRFNHTSIWLVDTATGRTRSLGEVKGAINLSWSPDGRTLAYISIGGTDGWQLHLRDMARGTDRTLTLSGPVVKPSDRHSVRYFSWSPDGKRIACVCASPVPKEAETEPLPKVLVMGESSQLHPTAALVNIDAYLGLIDIASGQVERVTAPEIKPSTYLAQFSWSSDGSRLLFPGEGAAKVTGRDPWSSTAYSSSRDIYMADLRGRTVRRIGGAADIDFSPVWTLNGEVAFVGNDSTHAYVRNSALRRIEAGGRMSVVLDGVDTREPMRVLKTDTLLFTQSLRANNGLYALPLSGPASKEPRLVTPQDKYVVDYSVAADDDTVAAILSDANNPPEIYVGSVRSGKFRKITDLYAEERAKFAFGHIEKVQWRSRDGRFMIDGFLLKPPGFDASKKYPLLVNIHGGPAADYLNNFADLRFNSGKHSQMEYFASNGYVVLMPNHRGGSTYGREFREALRHGRHHDSYDLDIDPGVDHVLSLGFIDKERIGLVGASYGGYAAAWAVTQTNRYKAVSINDSMFNLLSSYGVSYPMYIDYYNYYLGGSPMQKLEDYIAASPLFRARHISTPVMLRVGNTDSALRPYKFYAQSLELYAALRDHRVPVELLVHPYEGHGIADAEVSRDYLVRNLAWLDFWLLGRERPDADLTGQYARWRKQRETWLTRR